MAKNGEMKVLLKTLSSIHQPVIFDVGANKGMYIDAVLSLHPNSMVYAFEPNKEVFKVLEAKYFGNLSVFLNNSALGDLAGEINLYIPPSRASLASIYNRNIFDSEFKTQKVRLNTLDIFAKDNLIYKINFLKLDVEGHELSILRGAKDLIANKRIKFIQFEFGGCNIDSRTYFRDFWDLLNEEFEISKITSTGIWPIKQYSEQLEIFSTINYLAKLKSD